MFRSIWLLARSLRSSLPSSLLLGAMLLAWLAGCDSSSDVAARVSIPGVDSLETPAIGVGVVALPYDRDSVLAGLETRSGSRRPHTAALDSLFARFRGPFTTYTTAAYAVAQLRDSIDLLRRQLDSMPPATPQYRALDARYGEMSDSFARFERRAERSRVVLDRARAEFVSRSESLRSAVRQWEDSTYQGYESIVESLSKARRREPVTDTTDARGWARFSLPQGRWWLYARAWDTSDPNAEWYWNIPIEGDTMLLSSRTGRRRPRY